jgi:hypothetical protein
MKLQETVKKRNNAKMEDRYIFDNRQPIYARVRMVTIELGTNSEK